MGSLEEWLRETVTRTGGEIAEPVVQEVGNWIEIRLFISSTFVDTQAERDVLVKRVIPSLNRKLAPRYIRLVPVDLRWGVLAEESKDCLTIQKTCLNQVDKCRVSVQQTPWFLGLRTQRYGWVQNDMMPSLGFENPDLFKWIDEFASSGRKGVSITSLECIHAVQSPAKVPPSPTVFFYHRTIEEIKDRADRRIEANMRWVFEFEYKGPEEAVPEVSKYQYSRTAEADGYADDIANLNRYLRDIPHVKWNEFQCGYTVGGAKFTCKREGAKSFGVGYTSFLEAFERQVEVDLLEAIEENFAADSSSINDFQMETVQHENAIRTKASTFVGRHELVEHCTNHCNSTEGQNVMILHGEPGCGKSGLLAAVTAPHSATKLLRDGGNFVFIHVVDSCPGSNVLENMLRRLQWSLRDFRRSNGESNISPRPPEAASELRSEHHTFMSATAAKYPDKVFLIVVDAVNQFHEGMKAWDMWWLPRKEATPNLRFIISTLNKENGTFDNAVEACPKAVLTPVLQMSKEDLEGMISATLQRFNKKLTTYDDPLLGNQMELLLSKSTSPLYLIACCEALRKFGIFERVSQYIKSLPTTITDLFSFLLDEWSEEYGKMFAEDVAGLICVSKDGLLENEINDLLAFKEERERGDEEYLYDSSFSRIYDSLASFLAAGGGGYLRFFHDQLKYTVRGKFLTEEFALKTHQWLFDFFYECTVPQLIDSADDEGATEEPPAYYHHVLQQIIYHQLAATPKDVKLTTLDSTLRNIYFVRERVVAGQTQRLMDEYEAAISQCGVNPLNAEVSLALTQWKKFVQLYATNISELPAYCHNMAITQAPTSWVTRDTGKLVRPASHQGYPLIWENIPLGEDTMVCKYVVGGCDVVASLPAADLTVVATGKSVVILDQSSGEVLHRLDTPSYSVDLSPDYKTLYSGDNEAVTVWDVSTGSMVASSGNVLNNSVVVWIQHIGSHIACGTGSRKKAISWNDYRTNGEIALFNVEYTETLETELKWDVGAPCYHYCYLPSHHFIFAATCSASKGKIKGFNLSGELVMSLSGAGRCVYALSAHPTLPTFLSGSNDHVIREWNVDQQAVVRSVTDTMNSYWAFGGNWSVSYDPSGNFVLSTEPQSQSLRVYSFDNTLVDELKGHSDCINKIKLVPGTNQAITCDRGGGTFLFNLPDPVLGAAKSIQDIDEKVLWTGFSSDGSILITVSNGVVRKWDAKNVTLLCSRDLCATVGGKGAHDGHGFYMSKGVISSDEKWVYASGRVAVCRFSFENLQPAGVLEVLPDPDGRLSDFAITEDGSKLVGAECKNAPVWNISDWDNPTELLRYDDYLGRMFACAVHPDNIRAAIAGRRGTRIFNMETKETLFSIPRGCFWVTFLTLSDRIAYEEDSSVYVCEIESGEDVVSLKGHTDDVTGGALVREETQIYTSAEDGTIRLFDLATESCVYTFFNHRAQQYMAVGASPCGEKVAVGNKNGMLYVLKSDNYQ